MKMFFIVYDDYIDENTINALKQAGYKSYTKIRGAMDEGEKHEPRLDTYHSPGRNILAVLDDDIPRLIEIVQKLKEQYPSAGWRAFTFPLEQCI